MTHLHYTTAIGERTNQGAKDGTFCTFSLLSNVLNVLLVTFREFHRHVTLNVWSETIPES